MMINLNNDTNISLHNALVDVICIKHLLHNAKTSDSVFKHNYYIMLYIY